MEFVIDQISTTNSGRPPVSHKVREYLEKFILDNLLKPKKLIINTKWRIRLLICFVEEGPRYTSTYLFLAKQPTTITAENLKMYEILIPLKLLKGVDDPYLRTIELMFEALTIFFTTIYKSIKKEEMKLLWEKVDINYLFTLPYPASLKDQKYATDDLEGI